MLTVIILSTTHIASVWRPGFTLETALNILYNSTIMFISGLFMLLAWIMQPLKLLIGTRLRGHCLWRHVQFRSQF